MSNLNEVKNEYLHMLKDNIIPFWLNNGLDKKHSGYYTALDREGKLIDSDKSVWFQGRFAWVLSTLYADFEKNQQYLDAAKSGIDFLEKYCFDNEGDGRMFFRVTEDGKPIIKRLRYYYSETFCIIAMAAYSRASGDKSYIKKAVDILNNIDRYKREGLLIPKINQKNRPTIAFGPPMIMLATVQELRKADPDNKDYYNKYIDNLISDMKLFLYEDKKAVLEQCNPDGSLQDTFEGRLLNPGHALEASWFILRESIERNHDENLKAIGLKIFDWMWEWGWDKEYGGLLYFIDCLGKPPESYEHDMKLWWPHDEILIASLMIYRDTGDEKYLAWFDKTLAYCKQVFSDPEYGEWYGYLRRDGKPTAPPCKGSTFKGPFHLPRMLVMCDTMLTELLAREGDKA